jgi:ribose/xylose/arabinose/galactoside ABC-type transport system permease subunit
MKKHNLSGSKKSLFGNSILLGNKALLIVIILGTALSLATPHFFTSTNLLNLLRQICSSTIVALGFTFVLGLGEIDLSVGSMVGLIGIIMAKLMVELHVPVIVAILVGVICGMGFGVINASLISAINLPPFIVTLATLSLFRGGLYIITNMVPITNLPASFLVLGQGYVGPIPVPVIIMLCVAVVAYIIANYSKFGRYVIAMGGNKEAARVCGINTKLVRLGVFMTTGVCAALSSVVMTARSASAQIGAGLNMEMDVIAAVVIGGTAMEGGNMNIVGTFFGCVIVGMVTNGLNLLGINSNFQIVAKGLLILLALVLDRATTKFYANLSRKLALKTEEPAK